MNKISIPDADMVQVKEIGQGRYVAIIHEPGTTYIWGRSSPIIIGSTQSEAVSNASRYFKCKIITDENSMLQ